MSKNLFEDELNNLQALLQRDRFQFESSLPVLGPIIQKLRLFWNELSARWYVDHAVKQQINFDTQAVQLLRQMSDYIQHLEQQQARAIERNALLERALRETQEQYEIDLQALTRPTGPQLK